MAVVDKGFAVFAKSQGPSQRFRGLARLGIVHLQFLATSSLRLTVFLQWIWTYLTGQRGSRLIVDHHGPQPAKAAEEYTQQVSSR